jgi:DNA polymerase III alpha subunit
MNIDKYGQHIFTENDICEIYLTNTTVNFKKILTDKKITISDIVDTSLVPHLITHQTEHVPIQEFDNNLQKIWYMPESYKDFDIAQYVLDLCQTEEELQRVGQELLLFQERDMFVLLRYLKYLVDTMRENNIVWGVGRGSSVASYVLFLLGVHKINSIHYDLPIDEFLK